VITIASLDNSYPYRDGERYVIFDQLGPGVVYRIWMTGLDAISRGAWEATSRSSSTTRTRRAFA
jgi:hypothetical protein